MIRTVAVVRNINQSTYETSLPIVLGVRQGSPLSGFFYARTTSSALHAIAEHLHGWLGREHRAAHHPVDNPTELCARYRARQRDMVRQDLYRMNRILMGKLVHTHGLGGELLTLGETMSKRN
jgi:hypothetical protein